MAELEALPLTLVRTAPETSNYFQERSGLRSNGSVWSVALGSCQREEHHQAHARLLDAFAMNCWESAFASSMFTCSG